MRIGDIQIGLNEPLVVIAGPCVIEGEAITLEIAQKLKEITDRLQINFIFKASFDKANRTSGKSFRGLGLATGLKILQKIRQELNVKILTDVHEYTPVDEVVDVVDVLQTPAFLCRQTDFLQKVAKAGKPINIKKGQFLAPWDMINVVEKLRSAGNEQLMVCERGVSFGYNNLVVDMRSLIAMRATNCPVIFDATHSVQLPGGAGQATGGERKYIPALAKAAVACGISGIFMETHPNPDQALSDGPNSWPLAKIEQLLLILKDLDNLVKPDKFMEI